MEVCVTPQIELILTRHVGKRKLRPTDTEGLLLAAGRQLMDV